MGQGGDAAKKLQDQFAALNKIDAIRAQALRDNITLSDSQVASLTKLALAEGQSADVLQRATQLHNNLTDAMKKQDEEIQKLVQSSDLLTPKQDEIADKEGLLMAAFNQGTISCAAIQRRDLSSYRLSLTARQRGAGIREGASQRPRHGDRQDDRRQRDARGKAKDQGQGQHLRAAHPGRE